MSWYVITCRMSGDDEDSCYTVEASSWQEAARRCEVDLRLQADERIPDEDEEIDSDSDIREFYLNYAVDCGETKPTFAYGGGSDMPQTTGGGERAAADSQTPAVCADALKIDSLDDGPPVHYPCQLAAGHDGAHQHGQWRWNNG